MRPIDGDALLDEICRDQCERKYKECDGTCSLTAYVENTPTISGWISVNDKLPTSIVNKVLVWLEHEDLNGYIGFGHYEKYKGQEIWYDLEHNEAFSIRGYAVTHWMPLPEPPKEEEYEDR